MTVYLTFTDTGVVAPQTSEIKTEIQNIFTGAFGSDLSLDDSTPQGYVIDKLTEIIANQNSKMLFVINQYNPKFASGIFQDALAGLYFLERKGATPTLVQCVCTGLSGTVIAGLDSDNPAMAQNSDGDLFVCTSSGIIGAEGTVTLQFQSVKTGAIPAPANSVNRIYRQISGWDTINNTDAGVLGQDQENRTAFEARRKNSLALYAYGSKEAVYAKVFNVDGVTDVIVEENDTSISQTIQGKELTRNSIYVCVLGGDNTEIAQAMRASKSGGCATNGAVEVLLEGDYLPLKFDRPTPVNAYINVVLANTGNVPTDYGNTVKTAIINNFNGSDGSERVTIGQSVYASRFYSPVIAQGLTVQSITISRDNNTFSNVITMNLNELAVLDASNITVTIG